MSPPTSPPAGSIALERAEEEESPGTLPHRPVIPEVAGEDWDPFTHLWTSGNRSTGGGGGGGNSKKICPA